MKKQLSVNEAFKRLNDKNFVERKIKLTESVLDEAQLTVDKFQQSQFPKVPIQRLQKIVEIDPTFNKEKNIVGKYAKWLCNLAFKRNVDVLSDANEYTDQLSRFNSIFNQLPQDKRDLQKVKSIEELIDLTSTVQDDRVDMTDFEVRAEKDENVIFVGRVGNFDIYTPKTWEASKMIRNSGEGAEWCTGWSDTDRYFERYQGENFENGRLFIFQNRDLSTPRPLNKFQLSVHPGDKKGVVEFKDASNKYTNLGGKNDEENFELFLSKYELADEVAKINEIASKVPLSILNAKELERVVKEPYIYSPDKNPSSLVKTLVKQIVVPEGTTHLITGAFKDFSNVQSISLPNSLEWLCPEIDFNNVDSSSWLDKSNAPSKLFVNCSSLTEIVIPERVKFIPSGTFMGCTSMKRIEILSRDTIRFAISAFYRIDSPDFKIYIQPTLEGFKADSKDAPFIKSHMVRRKVTTESLKEDISMLVTEVPNTLIVEDNDCVETSARKVMTAYQDANKWLDSVKEAVYTNMNCPFLSSYIHNLAHTMPVRFDKFGDILHTVNMEIPYPETEEIAQKPNTIIEAIDFTILTLDAIKEALNEFIKCTDEKYHGMSCAAEVCLNDIESEYPMLYRLQAKAKECGDDTVTFDKYVMQYVEHKDELTESLLTEAPDIFGIETDAEIDKEADARKLAAHNKRKEIIDGDILTQLHNYTMLDRMAMYDTIEARREFLIRFLIDKVTEVRKGPDYRGRTDFSYQSQYKDKPVSREMCEKMADYIIDTYKDTDSFRRGLKFTPRVVAEKEVDGHKFVLKQINQIDYHMFKDGEFYANFGAISSTHDNEPKALKFFDEYIDKFISYERNHKNESLTKYLQESKDPQDKAQLKAYKELVKNSECYAVVYGYAQNMKGGITYLENPVVCDTEEELREFERKLSGRKASAYIKAFYPSQLQDIEDSLRARKLI